CGNDVTLRDLQKTDDQWARAKGFDGSCPLGPWIETDLDPNDVRVETRVNGEVRQAGQTSEMVFGVATLIEYVTTFMSLLPGDVILTGTPEGVGTLAAGGQGGVGVGGGGTPANPAGGAPRARTWSRARATGSARSPTRWRRPREPGRPDPVRARALGVDPRRQRSDGPVLVGARARPRRGVRAADRGHGRVAGHRGGLPRGKGAPPMARDRLGRGPRRRGVARTLPAVPAPRDLPRDDGAAPVPGRRV